MVKIGTHNGTFHCDEALACYMLRRTKKYENAEIIRTRNSEELSKLDVVVDVGAIYDPANGKFDHHQKGFFQTFSDDFKTKLSSAGLVYKHFGLEIIKNLTHVKDAEAKLIYEKVYESFIEGIDGIDNGISQYPSDLVPAYKISTDLSSRVSRLNPGWNEKEVDVMERFKRAMELTGNEFVERVTFYPKYWFPARTIVQQALESRKEIHSTGEILALKQYTIWKKHLFELEVEMALNDNEKIKYCLYEDQNGAWRIQAVPIHEGSFVSRIPLPEEWRGIRNEELSKVTGIEGGIFVHASGFIGGNKTFQGTLSMAKRALTMANTKSCNVKEIQPSTKSKMVQGFHEEALVNVKHLLKLMDTTLAVTQEKKHNAPKKQQKQKKQKQQKTLAVPARDPFTRLDIRVGRIHKVWKHENADSLYVEEIDLGEGDGKYRQVCSGLVKYIPLDQMQNSEVLVVVNLKPVNMRGITSYGMVLAAKSEDGSKVELVKWPKGSHCGERVSLEGKPIWDHIADREVDGKKKKSAWRKVQPKLKTNAEGIATYDGIPIITSQGPCFSTFKNSMIS